VTESIINHVAGTPPAPGHRISFVRLDGTETLDLPDLYARAGRLALELRRRYGIGPGDRIGILGANALEWVLLDLAALRLKVVTAGFEPGKFQADGALLARYDLTLLCTDQDCPPTQGVLSFREIRRLADLAEPDPGEPLPPVAYAPGDATTLKFTSGSTGPPKGLAATVGSIDSSLRAVQEMFAHGPGDDLFVFLPLSLLQQRYWIYSALRYGHDVTVSTYEAAFAALAAARPTVVMGVPAFYETAKKHIEARVRSNGNGANRTGANGYGANGAADGHAAEARRLFGDRIRYLWTGSAPAGATMLRFFTAAGLPIYEGYGLNETCIVSKNHPGAHREGSVGRVLPGKEVLLDENGVVSVRSDYPVNVRYEYAAPGESERVFGPGGIVRTGDVGHIDEDGFLYIRGRADDVIVLDNGKKVIVRPIEEHMKTSPAIEECVVFCPAQTHLVAVVSPPREPADEPAIAAQLARTNAAFGRDEQIKKIVVAEPRLSIENGLLTSQYKPRRQRIFELYRPEIQDNRRGIHAR
jgi:long-subunit acyl-CoA synthetase (AMP-forming)